MNSERLEALKMLTVLIDMMFCERLPFLALGSITALMREMTYDLMPHMKNHVLLSESQTIFLHARLPPSSFLLPTSSTPTISYSESY